MTPEEQFEKDIPSHLHDAIWDEISEAICRRESFGRVSIINVDKLDAINVRVEGYVSLDDEDDFRFIISDGNNNGTVLEHWNEDVRFEYHTPTRWALQPSAETIVSAIVSGRGPLLLTKWDAVLRNKQGVADIPRKFAYDRHFQSGSERHWRREAQEVGFEIVTEEDAEMTRARLAKATEPQVTTFGGERDGKDG